MQYTVLSYTLCMNTNWQLDFVKNANVWIPEILHSEDNSTHFTCL